MIFVTRNTVPNFYFLVKQIKFHFSYSGSEVNEAFLQLKLFYNRSFFTTNLYANVCNIIFFVNKYYIPYEALTIMHSKFNSLILSSHVIVFSNIVDLTVRFVVIPRPLRTSRVPYVNTKSKIQLYYNNI